MAGQQVPGYLWYDAGIITMFVFQRGVGDSRFIGFKFRDGENKYTKNNQRGHGTTIIHDHQDLVIGAGYKPDYPYKKADDGKQDAPQSEVEYCLPLHNDEMHSFFIPLPFCFRVEWVHTRPPAGNLKTRLQIPAYDETGGKQCEFFVPGHAGSNFPGWLRDYGPEVDRIWYPGVS